MGVILLAGGGEFNRGMEQVDRQALGKANRLESVVCIIPAAAAPDYNHKQAGARGVDWFRKLGVYDVRALAVIDRASANDPQQAKTLGQANLIYFLGGFPGHLAQTLSGSACWKAVLAAIREGAVLAGSSAGAMVLCEYFYDPNEKRLRQGLDLLSGCCVIPHHRSYGDVWAPMLRNQLPDAILIGIDEQTGMLGMPADHLWNVYGPGSITLYRPDRIEIYRNGDHIDLFQTATAVKPR